MNNAPNQLMSVDDVANLASVGRDTVMRWVANKQFVEPVRVGRRYFFSRQAVAEFFRLQADAAGTELRAIRGLQDNGLSLEQAVTVVEYHKAHPELSGAEIVAAVFDVTP
jgi:excisionase family DNA binding protein